MSSFLKDLLTIDKNHKSDLFEKIQIIKKEITKLKYSIDESMKDKYIELESNLQPDKLSINKSEQLIDDMKALQDCINNQVISKLTGSHKELQDYSMELKEYNYSLYLSNQLLQIYQGFQTIKSCKTNKCNQYTETAATLVKLHNLIIENSFDIQQLHVYTFLTKEYFRLNDNFIEALSSSWHKNIYWDENGYLNTKSVSLNIQCNINELTDMVSALHCINKLPKYVESLSTKLLQYFISPIIHFDCSVKSIDKLFSVQILDKKQVPTYKSIINNLKLVFEFLHQYFHIPIENEECFLKKLSNSLFQEFSNLLTTDCISKMIPTSTAEMETFKEIILEFKIFQDYLIDIKFINEEQEFLSKYVNNIDEFYIDTKIEKLLETARTLIKKDLHDSMKYKSDNIEESNYYKNFVFQHRDSLIDKKLSNFFFHLPECQISKNAQEIVCLVEKILEEACLKTDKHFLKLFYVTRNILEMYATLVPEIHKSYLDTIPQQVALFHNNCIYIAHQLLTLSYEYKKKIVSQDCSMIYVDQYLLLRQVGSECFLSHMKHQRDIIYGILRESGLSSIGQMPELPITTERALRQCIRQLELLKTVWVEILPVKMYCRVIGCIVNDMIDDIIVKITNIEDIPANVASELVTLFNMVTKRIPKIFPDSTLVEQHVQKWGKLKELIIILGASLKDIEDRWADGKGPLANKFSPQHVKQLIRALFQNTERRAHLLSKIKEK